MWLKGMRGKSWRLVREMYRGVKSAVLVGGESSDFFDVGVGVRQGDVLSPFLFNVFVEALVDRLREKGLGIKVEGTTVGIMLFADDIVLLADDEATMQKMLDELSGWCREYRMEPNAKKSAVLSVGGGIEEGVVFTMCGKEVGVRDKYKYLGVWLSDDLKWDVQVLEVVVKAKQAVRELGGVWACKDVGLRVKKNVWKAVGRPKMDYGGEVWFANSKQEASLESVQLQLAGWWLGCSSKTTREAVLGDLGLEPLKARRDKGKLKEWGKMCGMGEERLERLA